MHNHEYMQKLIGFIRGLEFNDLPKEVQLQAKKCFLDLASSICAGAKNNSSKCAARYVAANYPSGDYTILATGEKSNLIGATLANGMAANALDLDDGYSLLRGHPGSGFFGALVTAAENAKCTWGQVLTALVVAYEVSIRQGYAIRDFYGWDHSSGSYSTFAVAASVGKLIGLDEHTMEMALSIADFIMPVNPAKRSCYAPSMNKDGIYWGQHAGVQAVMMALSGITGKNPVLIDDKYVHYIDTLGEKFYLFDLYIKFYSCCRWAHSPIRAVASLMEQNQIDADDIENIDVYSFGNAGTLYKEAPCNEDEAQYNIKYPIAAQVLFGDCGQLESSTTKMLDTRIPDMIGRISFFHEPEYDKVFPAKRISRVEITLKGGERYISEAVEPQGDVNSSVSIDDVAEKVRKMNRIFAGEEFVEKFVSLVMNTNPDVPFAEIYGSLGALAVANEHPEIEFI